MIYRCSKCGYNTKHKSHFNSHMNKLYPCSNEVVVYTKEDWNSCQEKINDSINIDINELNKLSKDELIILVKELINK